MAPDRTTVVASLLFALATAIAATVAAFHVLQVLVVWMLVLGASGRKVARHLEHLLLEFHGQDLQA